ncbi:MAG: dienelactone hydrolase family protein [Halofilum sp. (in: g-proteobacteria)]|nr:dienelactone hydrolase family protein [Halofilum sp. (in: g-proteobacteria)]
MSTTDPAALPRPGRRARRGACLGLVALLAAGCSTTTVRSSFDGTGLGASVTVPEGEGPFPAVVLMHGCGGLYGAAGPSLRTHARYLADHGYASLVLDSFGPRNAAGGEMCSYANLGEARLYRTYDAFDAYRYLTRQPLVDADHVFLMGQSNGASVALAAAQGARRNGLARDHRFRAIVAYYPWCGAMASELATPVLMFVAGRDDWVDPMACKRREDQDHGVPVEVVMYPDAHHSFDVPVRRQRFEGRIVAGDQQAAADSRRRMVEFFDRYLADP